MDLLKLETGIKMYWKIFCMVIMPIPVICGCGAEKAIYCVDAPEENIQQEGKPDTIKQTAIEKAGDGVNKSAREETAIDESKLYKNVPVYAKKQQKKIKKYLSSLPNEITEEEAKKKGIVVQLYDIDKNNFNTMWQGFCKYTQEGEEALYSEKSIIKCYAEPFKAAIVLLRYTTEGDACYTYISFIEDKYYVVTDNSRDKFRGNTGDGINEIGTFKSLRERMEVKRDGNKNYYNVIYSVFKKPRISKKEIKKVIKKPDSYARKYYDLFDYYTSKG